MNRLQRTKRKRRVLPFPWANILVLFLLISLTITGYFGFTNGRFPYRWLLWLHGISAYALLLTLFWKMSVIFDAWRRKKTWTAARRGFVVLLFLLLVTLLLGLLWTFNGPIYVGGFSLVSLHIYVAIPLMGLMLWHSWRMRFVWRLPETVGRRLWLGTAVSALVGLLFWRTADWAKVTYALTGSKRRFTGSYETGSFTGQFPSVSWIADRPPQVALADWRLLIAGAVAQSRSLTYDDIMANSTQEIAAIIDCTGGWYSEQQWRGVWVSDLLAQTGTLDEAASVTFKSMTGYKRRFSIEQASKFLLATHVGGKPLTPGHGFPLRLVAINERGVEWVKWVAQIEVNRTSAIWQLPLPLQ